MRVASAPMVSLNLGRIDQQVKIRGFRIELARSRRPWSRIRVCVSVNNVAAAMAAKKRALSRGLVGDPLSIADLRAQLAATLPDYMIPAAFVGSIRAAADATSGKIDRQVCRHRSLIAARSPPPSWPRGLPARSGWPSSGPSYWA